MAHMCIKHNLRLGEQRTVSQCTAQFVTRGVSRKRMTNYSNVGRLRFLRSHMALDDDVPPLSVQETLKLTILAEMPFVIPFIERVMILRDLIKRDKEESQGDMPSFLAGFNIDLNIRRDFIYEDAYDRLRPEN
ncbi:ubiquitin-protein ligase E3C-like, partial [Anneissia japonica]|uniref:ubiquitin-protein ligase E3C-like n=1 Tax=Anneissia japonica TaxID=1529436 RepID=UPI00142580D1